MLGGQRDDSDSHRFSASPSVRPCSSFVGESFFLKLSFVLYIRKENMSGYGTS